MPGTADRLRLLSDETRLRILHLLEREPLTVAELQELLDLGQSSISGHLAKLKHAGLVHDVAEGSAHRYRLREDPPAALREAWLAARALSMGETEVAADQARLAALQRDRGASWVERVAGSLHREYAPGRSWEGICHAVLPFVQLGRCADIGAGDGTLAELLAPQARELACIDPSPAMVKAGEARLRGRGNVRWLQAAGEKLPLPDAAFDSALLVQSLQYAEDPAKVLAEAARILAPGGRLLLLTLARHEHPEAARFGHRHRGFEPAQLKRWSASLDGHQHYLLPPEPRPPRFQTLLFTAAKP